MCSSDLGGIPRVVNHYLTNRYKNHEEKIDSSIAEIFIRDILGDLLRLQKQEAVIRETLKAVVERYGSRYSFSKLSREIERNHITVIDYLETLEDSFIFFILYAYDFNKKDVKSKGDKKIYFLDPFIFHSVRSYIGGKDVWSIITETLEDEEIQSRLTEGIAISHLLAHKEIPYMKIGKTFLWNYYDRSGKEIDAVIRTKRKNLGIEVKYQAQVDERDINQIVPIRNYFILSKEDIGRKENTMVVPIDVFFSLLTTSERNV